MHRWNGMLDWESILYAEIQLLSGISPDSGISQQKLNDFEKRTSPSLDLHEYIF